MFSSLYNAFGGWTHAEDSSTPQSKLPVDAEHYDKSLQQKQQAAARLQTATMEGSVDSRQDSEDLDEVSNQRCRHQPAMLKAPYQAFFLGVFFKQSSRTLSCTHATHLHVRKVLQAPDA